jgi:hypothetical protein
MYLLYGGRPSSQGDAASHADAPASQGTPRPHRTPGVLFLTNHLRLAYIGNVIGLSIALTNESRYPASHASRNTISPPIQITSCDGFFESVSYPCRPTDILAVPAWLTAFLLWVLECPLLVSAVVEMGEIVFLTCPPGNAVLA